MPFSEDIKIKALVSCGRKCCICHKFWGNNMEIHHIKAKADGGDDSFGNAIPLCFDCHAEVRQYDPRHPKGIKFSEKELILHRDNWYKKIKQENQQDNDKVSKEPVKMHHEQNYQHIMLHKANTGNDILFYLEGALGIVHDEQAETLEEAKLLGEFVQYLFDTIDMDFLIEPYDRVMTAYNLSENLKELDDAGFWVFVGKENRKVTGGVGSTEMFPVLIVRIVRKNSNEIIKHEL